MTVLTSICVTSPWRYLDTRPYYAVDSGNCSWVGVDADEELRLGLRPGTKLPRCVGLSTDPLNPIHCNPVEFGAWWDQTNYATRPHVTHFDSFQQFFAMFESFDAARNMFKNIGQGMLQERQSALDFARDWYRGTLTNFLGASRVVSNQDYERNVENYKDNSSRGPSPTEFKVGEEKQMSATVANCLKIGPKFEIFLLKFQKINLNQVEDFMDAVDADRYQRGAEFKNYNSYDVSNPITLH